MQSWTPCKNADALDFFRPEFVEHIRAVKEEPRMHCKQWEYAQLLEVRRQLAPEAKRLVGLGCGCEPTIPLVGAGAERVTVTDLYNRDDAWDVARRDPRAAFPEMDNLEVHTMDMTRVDLPKKSADFVWSLCAVEHVGELPDIIDAVRQAGELLDDDGVMFISTELNLSGGRYRTKGTLFLSPAMIEELVRSSGLHLVAPIELKISDHPMNTPVWSGLSFTHDALPHVIYRVQRRPFDGIYGTVVSFVLGRRDRGVREIWDVDPDHASILRKLGDKGRKINRRMSPIKRWW
jgi:hypothetical protein